MSFCSYVLGHEAMKRMGSSNVLIVGLKGLGVEVGMSRQLRTWCAYSLDTMLTVKQPKTLLSPVSSLLRYTILPPLTSQTSPLSSFCNHKMSASPVPKPRHHESQI